MDLCPLTTSMLCSCFFFLALELLAAREKSEAGSGREEVDPLEITRESGDVYRRRQQSAKEMNHGIEFDAYHRDLSSGFSYIKYIEA